MKKFFNSKTNNACFIVFCASFPMAYLLKGSFGEWVSLMITLLGVIGVKNSVQSYVDTKKKPPEVNI